MPLISKSNSNPNWLACTPGEPAGIGPDILLALSATHALPIVAYADRELLKNRAALLGLSINIIDYSSEALPKTNTLQVRHVPLHSDCIPGTLNPHNAAYVLETLTLAVQDCLNGTRQALVTGPVHKAIINEAGIAFTGHTEFLASLTHSPRTVMMLANEKMRVCLLTTHLPLRQVPNAITDHNLKECLKIIHHDLVHKFNLNNPRIGVCGLNPHAGENGHLGREEIEIITPALDSLRQQGMHVIGPLSADTIFTAESLNHFDVILTMYHDQGLPVIKALGFGETVNITLGLPIIRTSVDHGTALSLAGTGSADASSLLAAINLASAMADHLDTHHEY